MKIKLLVSRSGADGAYSPGDEIDVSADEAKRMIEAGQAEPIRNAAVKAAREPVERAVSKPAKETR